MERYHVNVNLWFLVAFKHVNIKKVDQARNYNAKMSFPFMYRVDS